MLKQFRRRVIGLNFVLIALVLLILFTVAGVFMHRIYMGDLQADMEDQLQSAQDAYDRTGSDEISGDGRIIVSGVYNKVDGSVTFTGRYAILEGVDLEETVVKASSQWKDFGRLADPGVYYYAVDSENEVAVALTDAQPVRAAMRNMVLILVGIYIAVMAVLLAVIVWLSKVEMRAVEEAWKKENKYMADISRELRTPLRAIRADVAIMMDDPLIASTEAPHWAENTERSLKLMSGLIKDLPASSAASDSKPEPKKMDLSRLMSCHVHQVEALAYEKDVRLCLDEAEDLFVWADAAGLNLVVENLLWNAIWLEPVSGRVDISLTGDDKQVKLRIRNRMFGIGEAEISTLFDKSGKLLEDREKGPDLAIARQAAGRVGGSVRVVRPEEGGICFEAVFKRKIDTEGKTEISVPEKGEEQT